LSDGNLANNAHISLVIYLRKGSVYDTL